MSFPSDLDIARSVTPRPSPTSPTTWASSTTRSSCTAAPRPRSRSRASSARSASVRAASTCWSPPSARRPWARARRTTTVGLAQGLQRIGKKAAVALRQPSPGPRVRDQGRRRGRRLLPGHPDGGLQPPPHGRRPRDRRRAQPRRGVHRQPHPPRQPARPSTPTTSSGPGCVDISDRALREIVVGLGGKENGYPRQSQFVITVASEVMAILALASDLRDLRARLGGSSWPRRRTAPRSRPRTSRSQARWRSSCATRSSPT